jgi:hypothetical protein
MNDDLSTAELTMALVKVCTAIRNARGIDFQPPFMSVASFAGYDDHLSELEQAAQNRAFDWRASVYVADLSPFVHCHVTYKRGAVSQQLWVKSPQITNPDQVAPFTWSALAQLEAMLEDAKAPGFTPAKYEG